MNHSFSNAPYDGQPHGMSNRYSQHPPPPSAAQYHSRYPTIPQGSSINTNNGSGTFNDIRGHQHNHDNSTTRNETIHGDTFSGDIHGGIVGGRNNTNSMHNNPGRTSNPSNLGRPGRGASGQATVPVETVIDWAEYGRDAAELKKIEKDIEALMDRLGYGENAKAKEWITQLKAMKKELKSKLSPSQ